MIHNVVKSSSPKDIPVSALREPTAIARARVRAGIETLYLYDIQGDDVLGISDWSTPLMKGVYLYLTRYNYVKIYKATVLFLY